MQPQTISEQLMFNTIKLETNAGKGTGFFHNFVFGDKSCTVLITNKHVLNYSQKELVTAYVHLKDADNTSTESINVSFKASWIFHSSKDLCFCFINALVNETKKLTNKEIFYIPSLDNIIATPEKLESLSALEEIAMVGYPIGLSDEKNNYPIFRRGYTATHPNVNFDGECIGVVDMACFPGSSGSPIYVLNEGAYTDKRGNIHVGTPRVILLGILYAGPQLNVKGDIIVTDIPTKHKVQSDTPIMINLGYYIKAEELNEFREYVSKFV